MKTLIAAACLMLLPLVAFANPAIPALEALREGDMKKMVFHIAPKPASEKPFLDPEGNPRLLSEFHGQIVLLNFWATWCAPCRKEMPGLDRLQAEFGGDDFQVITLATGRNSPAAIRRFFEEENLANLPQYNDDRQAVARDMGVLGLPITVILDRDGREIARLRGDADWDSDSAKAIVLALMGNGAG